MNDTDTLHCLLNEYFLFAELSKNRSKIIGHNSLLAHQSCGIWLNETQKIPNKYPWNGPLFSSQKSELPAKIAI